MPGVYISYPFCAQKCTYCNFASGVFPRELERRYVERLVREIATHDWQWQPETVYLGGGTPGTMTIEALGMVLSQVPGAPWTEATIEASPGMISGDLAGFWRSAGITRVSLGVQSFADCEIRQTGRKHNARVVAEEVQAIRAAGISQINIDLIAGLAGQTAASWKESLDCVERLAPQHVSIYMLEVDEDSRLGRELLKGGRRYGAGSVPSEDAIADFYEAAVTRLKAMGLPRYEISNFGRPSLHNLKYWRLEPYAGFGADAHSFDGGMRRKNVESVGEYVERADPCESSETATDEERFFLGLRLAEGIQPGTADWDRYGSVIGRFVDAGLLETDGITLRLTGRGVLLSNEVFQEFLAA